MMVQHTPPRMLNAAAVASLFGKSRAWFYEHRHALERDGFPRRDQLLKSWDRMAIERWLDCRVGLSTKAVASEDAWSKV